MVYPEPDDTTFTTRVRGPGGRGGGRAVRAGPGGLAAALTAKELVDRITAQIGVPWKAETVDGLKAGDPATVVTGVVTTAMATLAVLQQAVKAGANVVISSQPTFYAKADARTPPAPRGPGGVLPAGGSPAAAPPPLQRRRIPCSPPRTRSSISTSWSSSG